MTPASYTIAYRVAAAEAPRLSTRELTDRMTHAEDFLDWPGVDGQLALARYDAYEAKLDRRFPAMTKEETR